MCGGGSVLGGIVGAALAPFTGGLSLAASAALGAAAGSVMIDQPDAQRKSASLQRQAMERQTAEMNKQARLAEEANNRANARRPDVAAMMSRNAQSAKSGGSGTMLTGPSGVDKDKLKLSKQTLLGGT